MLTLDRQNSWREQYRRMRPGWQPATERFAAQVRQELQPGMWLLDPGCGRGGLVEQLGHPAGRVVGADADVASLREHRLPEIHRVAAIGRLPFADQSFDLACASWVLEHWEQPLRELREIARVLRPGGRFVFITPNRLHPLIRLNRGLGAIRSVQTALVSRLYGREEGDTFPVWYRASSGAQLKRLAKSADLHLTTLELISDPSYLAFNAPLFRLICLLEEALPASHRLHLVGVLTKKPAP
jgi:SAM-dependent methyltransferase